MTTRSRLVGKSLGYFPKDRVFESHLRYNLINSLLFLLFLFMFNTFELSRRFRENPKHIFYNKRVPKGISGESAVNPFFERLDNPKGSLAYINFLIMSKEKIYDLSDDINVAKLKLLSALLNSSSSNHYLEFISQNTINAIVEEMRSFDLTGEDVADKLIMQNELVKFFYGLSCLNKRESLQIKLEKINKISAV